MDKSTSLHQTEKFSLGYAVTCSIYGACILNKHGALSHVAFHSPPIVLSSTPPEKGNLPAAKEDNQAETVELVELGL